MSDRRARTTAMATMVGTLAIGLLLVIGGTAAAEDSGDYLPAFRIAYPDAAGTRIDNCSLCHFTNSEGKWDENQFAEDFEDADESFTAVQNLDSDGDGFTNFEEIQAGTFPGANADNPASVVTTTTVAAPPGSGESIYQANCAGCHGGSGGNLLGRGLTLGQISSAVTNGVTGMPGYSNTLTPAEIDLVSQYVLTVDSTPTTTTTTAPGTPPPPPPDGATVYASNCAACHGAGGGDLVGRGLTKSQVSAVTNSGTTGMPGYSTRLNAAEIEAVSAYVAGLGGSSPTTTTTTPGSPPPDGATVWAESCAACHGAAGGDLVGHSLTETQLLSATANGQGTMPGFSTRLSSAQINAVVAYLSALRGDSSTSSAGPGGGDGSSLYAKHCSSCHGVDGEGGIGGSIVDEDLDAEEVREVLLEGDEGMPSYADLSDEELDALIQYTLLLTDGANTSADVNTNETEDSDDTDESSDDDDQGSALFLGSGDESEPGKSPFIVISLLAGVVGIIGVVGVMWLRSARALVE